MTATATDTPAATGVPDTWTTSTLLAALIKHYRKPGTPRDGCVLITEAEAPGASLRRCDLIHIGVASRGRGIDGHELKISRSDWLRELADPAKADAWWPYCTRWWIVAPAGVVHDDELPEGWGLMEPRPHARMFRIARPATVKEPKLTVDLLAELLRQSDNERLGAIDKLRADHRAAMADLAQKFRTSGARGGLDPATARRLGLLDQVEAALGMTIEAYGWSGKVLTPAELAAALEEVPGHVSAQRLMRHVDDARADLRAACQSLLRQLDTPR